MPAELLVVVVDVVVVAPAVAAVDVVCMLAAAVVAAEAGAWSKADVGVVEDVNVETWIPDRHSGWSFSVTASFKPFMACGSASAVSLQLRAGVVGGVADMDSTVLQSSVHETVRGAAGEAGGGGATAATGMKLDFVFGFGLFSFTAEDLMPSVLVRSTTTAAAAAAAVSISRRSNGTLWSTLGRRQHKCLKSERSESGVRNRVWHVAP